ncbi:hypothetical protein D6779_03270 [Candidatus Parcubacteria bacterium]|nr:MAG: hypothetical protein D6779_03270 [Candidatus Parcubacteria bacterium]
MGFLSIAVVYLLVFTSSRGGWMGWGAELATWIGIASWQQRKKGGLLDNRLWKRKHWWSVLFWGGIVFTSVRLALWESMDPTHPSSWNQPLASRDYIWQVAGQMWATHPWFGMGPGTYGLAFVDNASVPPDILLTHAHNLYLNVLAETGSIGLLAFFWLLIQTGRQAWKQVQAYPRNEVIAMGIVPALCGVAVHGMVEVSLGIPAILLLVVTYVALLFAESPSVPTRKPQWSTWFTGCVLVVSLAGMWINTLEFRQHAAAVLAGMEGHWNTAAFKLRQLGEMDPWNAVYWRQSGYAFGRHALDPWGRLQDQTSAQRALQDYEQALHLDSHYAVPWANRAVLLWASGQPVEAVRSLEVAVEKAPRQAVFWATLGAWEEMLGQRSQALVAYRQAITLEPDWRETAFFQATTLRQEAVNTVTSSEGALDLGWKALQEGNISLATQVFMESADVNQAEAWLGLGMVALRQQDWAAAQRYVAMASLMDVWGRLKIRLTGAKGDAFFQQGDCTRAAGYYEKVWWMMRRGDSFQYGREGSQWYDWFIYRRWTFDEDLLPGFAPVFFEEDIERLHRLRECYSQEGQVERLVMLQDWLRQLEEMQEIWAK